MLLPFRGSPAWSVSGVTGEKHNAAFAAACEIVLEKANEGAVLKAPADEGPVAEERARANVAGRAAKDAATGKAFGNAEAAAIGKAADDAVTADWAASSDEVTHDTNTGDDAPVRIADVGEGNHD